MITFAIAGGITGLIAALIASFYLLHYFRSQIKNLFSGNAGTGLTQLIKQKATGSNSEELKKDILLHFDDYMHNRLTVDLPVLNMFIDDKLIEELRVVFQKEMENILPKVLDKHLSSMQTNDTFTQLSSAFSASLKETLDQQIKKKIVFACVLSFDAGIVIGVLASLV